MGTNFYWRDKPCDTCGRFEEIHVCKSRRTWRAYRHDLIDPDHPGWGYNPLSPFGFAVLCLDDWRKIFAARPGELFSEYGDRITDPVAWLDEADRYGKGPVDTTVGCYTDEDGYLLRADPFS
jgi:hypothetical protein